MRSLPFVNGWYPQSSEVCRVLADMPAIYYEPYVVQYRYVPQRQLVSVTFLSCKGVACNAHENECTDTHTHMHTHTHTHTHAQNVLAGALFGVWWGVPLVCILTAFGASACYLLSWAFGRRIVETYLSHRIAPLRQRVRQSLADKEDIYQTLPRSLSRWFVTV